MDVSFPQQATTVSYSKKIQSKLNVSYQKIGASNENTSRAFTVSISKEAASQSISYLNNISPVEKVTNDTRHVLTASEKKHLFNAFFDLQGESSFRLKNMLVNLPEKERNNLLAISSVAGESMEDLLDVLGSLSQEDRSLFLAVGTKTQEGLDHLIQVTDSLEGEFLTQFLTFADSLEEENLPSFLEASDAVDDKLTNLIKMGNRLGEEYQKELFKAATNAKGSSDRLFLTLETILDHNSKTSGIDVRDFLNVTANTEGAVTEVFSLVGKIMNDVIPSDFLNFGANLSGSDLSRYMSYGLNNYDTPVALSDFMNLTRQLSGENLSNYLKIAAHAGGSMDKINLQITEMVSGHAEDTPKILADYLQVAAKTDEYGDAFTRMVSKLDNDSLKSVLSVVSGYNEPDAQNFVLGVVDENGEDIVKLANVTNMLSVQEKSWLLFALGDHNHDGESQNIDAIFSELEIFSSRERKEYLRTLANAEQDGGQDDWVHLRDSFSRLEITYIDKINKNQAEEDLNTLMNQMENLDDKNRLNYLRTAAYAEEALSEFMDMFAQFSEKEKSLFLSASETFSHDDLNTFIRASETVKGDIEGFVSLLNDLQDREPLHLIRAVSNAGERSEELLALVDSISGQSRQAFLLAAAYSGKHVGGLVDLANQFIENEWELFNEAANRKGNDINDLFTHVKTPIKKHGTDEVLTEINSLSLVGTRPPQAFSELFMSAFRAGDHLEGFLNAYLS